MDLDQAHGSTTPFYTLHSCDGDIAGELAAILADDSSSKEANWQELLDNRSSLRNRLIEQGLAEPLTLEELRWDDSMLLFTCSIHLDEEGKPMTVGENLTRERFGRFPYGNGSLIGYVLEYLRPNSSVKSSNEPFNRILNLLNKLNSFNTLQNYDAPRYDGGMGGMNILGFLSFEEVVELRKLLGGRNWSVASDEPLDGGIRDAVKHLLAMIKAAERRDSGVMHRAHS